MKNHAHILKYPDVTMSDTSWLPTVGNSVLITVDGQVYSVLHGRLEDWVTEAIREEVSKTFTPKPAKTTKSPNKGRSN